MERIIFILSYEKKWESWMVYAHHAEDAGDFFLSGGRYVGGEADVPPVVKGIAEIILKYDTPALFRQFGRKRYKDEREFLKKVEESYIREDIRPYIEKYVAQVLDELADAGLPLFLKGSRLDNFYKTERIFLQSRILHPMLRFERTGEFTRYVLRLTDGEREYFPADYALKVLTCRPCRVLSGKQFFRFPEDFDGQRLLPFLDKKEVMIPKANEREYFRRFILKNVRHEEIEVLGFEVIMQEVAKQAFLSLERDVFGRPVLALLFRYGKQTVSAGAARRALVELRTEGDSYAFYKVSRDFEWEQNQKERIAEVGLEMAAAGNFRLEKEVPELSEKEMAATRNEEKEDCGKDQEDWCRMVEWVRCHRAVLAESGIGFVQNTLGREYYVGEWGMDYSEQESPDWFELKAEIVLEDGHRIPLIRFREHILSGRREFMLLDGRVFLIPEEWFSAYSEILLFAYGRDDRLFLHRNQYPLLCHGNELPEQKAEEGGEVVLPEDLRAQMRPYQRDGYAWMYRLYRRGLGGCLADDMGLGKTLQTIALLLRYRQEAAVRSSKSLILPETGTQLNLFDTPDVPAARQPGNSGTEGPELHTSLVIVPASLVHNWRNELRKFAPRLSVTVYAGQNRLELRPYLQTSDVVIVTYHTLRNDIEYFSRLTFGFVIADEAQVLKNPSSQIHQAMLRIRGHWFLALSGTPVENSLSDLWAVMNFVNRDLLGNHAFFRDHFIRPIIQDIEGKMSGALRRLIAPYILRRTKEEVLDDLPELTSELVICEMDEKQESVYEEEQARVRNYILGKRENQEGLRNDFMILKALIRLRQIADHPRLVDADYPGDSGKFREIFRMLGEVIGSGHKVLVFSSFVKYLRMVADEAARMDWKYALLTGTTVDREREIARFSSDPDCHVFLISLKAGGVGLNLTDADYVFILDPWWNVAAENQAVGRAHRIGQRRAVFVYRFIASGTLEEKILAIQQRKQQLSDVVIGNAASAPLSDAEILEALE